MEIEVAIPSPLFRTFTYEAPEPVTAGSRVLVPFSGRKLVGVVLGPAAVSDQPRGFKIKAISEVLDETPAYSATLLKLAKWLSDYYLHPPGEVLRAMLPAGLESVRSKRWHLTRKGRAARSDGDPSLTQLFNKQDELNDTSLKAKIKRLTQQGSLAAGVNLGQLTKAGLVKMQRTTTVSARILKSNKPAKKLALDFGQRQKDLTPEQRQVFQTIVSDVIEQPDESKPVLLRGVTGSGKTEVYLQLIAQCHLQRSQADGPPPQALVLVPEISLTPQMTQVFEQRFPGRVAVVHSGMADNARWEQIDRVRSGEALILIGPRSAVFAPFLNLRLLIVDEEHDSSYKQVTGLTYNGRDVAVLRARLEGAAVILGSATPSMESYANACARKYLLCEMKERVTGSVLPDVKLINAQAGYSKGTVLSAQRAAPNRDPENAKAPIHPDILQALQSNFEAGLQSIVLVNRRGFAFYLFSLNDKASVRCPNCSISMTLHRGSTGLHCHYCDYRTTTLEVMRNAPDDQFLAVGYGSERVESYLQEIMPGANVERLDSDIAAKKDALPEVLARFRQGKIDILVGTQILAKGHDFPRVTLICLLDLDQTLELPDFRAGERTFQLIVQAAGRAGRSNLKGQVLVQTSRGGHPVVQTALAQDFASFAEQELKLREMSHYPPFANMVAFESSSSNPRELTQFVARIERWLEGFARERPDVVRHVKILGPSVPAIEMIRKRHRRTLIMISSNRQQLWALAKSFQSTFANPGGDLRLKVDVDPQALL